MTATGSQQWGPLISFTAVPHCVSGGENGDFSGKFLEKKIQVKLTFTHLGQSDEGNAAIR